MKKRSYKKYFIVISILLILFSLSYFKSSPKNSLKKQETIVDERAAQIKLSSKKISNSKKGVGQHEHVQLSTSHYISNSSNETGEIPWEELNQKWREELKAFIVNLDPDDGEKKFALYLKEKAIFDKKEEVLQPKMQAIYKTKPVDKKLLQKLENESADEVEAYTHNLKKIFGKYYPDVQKFYNEYSESIQVYSRDVHIGVDIGF